MIKIIALCLVLFCSMGAGPCWVKREIVYNAPAPQVVTYAPIVNYVPQIQYSVVYAPVYQPIVVYVPVQIPTLLVSQQPVVVYNPVFRYNY